MYVHRIFRYSEIWLSNECRFEMTVEKKRKNGNEIELFCHAEAKVREDMKFQSFVSLKLSVIHKTYRFPNKAIWLIFYAITATNRKRAVLSYDICYPDFRWLFFFFFSFSNYRCSNWAFFVSYCFKHYRCCCGYYHFYCHIQFNPLIDASKVKKEIVFCALFYVVVAWEFYSPCNPKSKKWLRGLDCTHINIY